MISTSLCSSFSMGYWVPCFCASFSPSNVLKRTRPRWLSSELLRRVVCWRFTDIEEAASTTEMSVDFYQTTRRSNPMESHLYIRRLESVKSHTPNLNTQSHTHTHTHTHTGSDRPGTAVSRQRPRLDFYSDALQCGMQGAPRSLSSAGNSVHKPKSNHAWLLSHYAGIRGWLQPFDCVFSSLPADTSTSITGNERLDGRSFRLDTVK
jgi:hypothetical protein